MGVCGIGVINRLSDARLNEPLDMIRLAYFSVNDGFRERIQVTRPAIMMVP